MTTQPSGPGQPEPGTTAASHEHPSEAVSSAPQQAEQTPKPRSASNLAVRIVQAVVGIGAAVVLLGWVLPWITHTTWGEILDRISLIGWPKALWLLFLMLVALSFYTFTLVGSLPGLKHRPALVVNLIGSGVSDAMPGGGAVGLAAQYAVFRSWGFSHRNIGTSVIITTIWNLLMRALLPFGAIVWLLLGGAENLPKEMIWGGWFAASVAAMITVLTAAILVNDKSAHLVGRALDKVVVPVMRLLKKAPDQSLEQIAVDIRGRVIGVIRPNWPGLTIGLVGLLGVYFEIFRECVVAFGIDLPWPQLFACYALRQMLTMVPLTPGGIGVTELASVLMIAFGADGGAAAASILLFAIYSHLLEIPLGAIMGLVWWKTKDRFYVGQEDGPTTTTNTTPAAA